MITCKAKVENNGVLIFAASVLFVFTASAAADLTAYYPFDGTAADSSGNNRNGTASDNGTVGIYWTSGGMIGSSVGFDGDGPADNTNTLARVEIPASSITAGAGTLAFWAKLNSSEPYTSGGRNNNVYFFGLKGSGSYDKIFIYNQNDTNLKVEVGNKATTNAYVLSRAVWYHIALTWDSSEFAVYVNGVEAKRLTYANLANIPAGCDIGNSGQTGHKFSFHGLLDDFRIYNTALTAEEIFTLYGGAGDPVPANGAQDLSLSQTLSWSAGSGATSHNVYFGSTSSPPLAAANLIVTNYQLPTLSYSTVYYWRIDEVNSSGSSITGRLWSFSTLGLPAPASNPDPANGAANVAPDKVLTWTAGARTSSSDVYFGTVNPPPFVQNQTSTQYAILNTQYETIYYWRINGINQAGTTVGPLWSFKTATKKPTNPSPANGATNVAVTATLSWTAGYGATARDVYFGTAEDPDFIDTRTATSYQPPTLQYSTAYYWHIDELSPGGMTGGDLWSFTTAAAPVPTQATAPNPAVSAKNVPIDTTLSWTAGANTTSHNVYFGTTNPPPFLVNQTQTSFDPTGLVYVTDWDAVAYFIEHWLSPYDFTDYAVMAPGMVKQISGGSLNMGATYFWRIDEAGVNATATGQIWNFTTVSAKATNPSPADGSKNQSVNVDLSWTAGSGATSHDVYFGTANPPPFIRNQTAAVYDPGTMPQNTLYYWRIDERSAGAVATGDIWSFTTYKPGAPVADFTATPLRGTAPMTVQFTDQSSGDITSWYWDYNEPHETMDYVQNPSHTFSSASAVGGLYSVALTVTGPSGSDTKRKVGYIFAASSDGKTYAPYVTRDLFHLAQGKNDWYAPVTVDFWPRLLRGCGEITSWLWEIVDENYNRTLASTEPSFSRTFYAPGHYWVYLTVSGPGGSKFVYDEFVVTSQAQLEQSVITANTVSMLGYNPDVDVQNGTMIAGAAGDSELGQNAGAAYIFKFNGTNWVQQAKLTAFDGQAEDRFGVSTSIDGSYAVVGTCPPADCVLGIMSDPALYVFRYDGVNWLPEVKIQVPVEDRPQLGDEWYDRFGVYSVSINGDYILAGNPEYSIRKDRAGTAYVYLRSGSNWNLQTRLFASDSAPIDYFGYGVDLDGEYAVITAPLDIVSGVYEDGSVYIFKRSGTAWTQQTKLVGPGGVGVPGDDGFGFGGSFWQGIALDGDRLAVLEAYFSVGYIYERSGSNWALKATLQLDDPIYGDETVDPFDFYHGYATASMGMYLAGDFVMFDRSQVQPWSILKYYNANYVFKKNGTNWGKYAKLATSNLAQTYLGGLYPPANMAIAGGYEEAGKMYVYDISSMQTKVTVSATAATAAEGGANGAFEIRRTGGTTAAVNVNYIAGGTATAGLDYRALSGEATIPSGSSSVAIPVEVVDDSLRELPETVTVTITAADGGAVIGFPATAAVTINDNEPRPAVHVTATVPDAYETNQTAGKFTFYRSSFELSLPLTVHYTVSGLASNGKDYQVLSGSIAFPANTSTVEMAVVPIDDSKIEMDETVDITIDPNGLAYTIDTTASASVTVYDNDLPAGWQVLTYDGFEGDWDNFDASYAIMNCWDSGFVSAGSCSVEMEIVEGCKLFYNSFHNIAAPGYTQLQIQFDFIAVDLVAGDKLYVQYYDGSVWQTVKELRYGIDFDNFIFYTKTVDIYESQYTFPTNMKIRFMTSNGDGWRYVYLDEIIVAAK